MRNIIFIFVVSFLVGCASSPSKQYQVNMKDVPLYGYLSKTAKGEFYFSSFQHQPGEGAWVRLNDGKPMWRTDCTNMYNRCYDNEHLFIYGRAFYEDEYMDAYEEALAGIEGGNESIQAEIAKLNPAYTKFKKASERYKKSVNELKTKVKFDVVVDDRTGLYDNSINFRAWPTKLFISSPIQADTLRLVADSDFNKMVSKYQRALENKVREINLTNSMNVTCNYSGKSKFYVKTIKCPSSIPRLQSTVLAKPVIAGVTFEQVVPTSFKGADKYISYIFNHFSVNVTNKTNQFITVSSVSFYHNNKIATNEGINYDLPPHSVKEVAFLRNMRINKEAITFYNVTKTSAQAIEVPYGIAIKYKLGNGESKTLYNSFNFTLYDLIK